MVSTQAAGEDWRRSGPLLSIQLSAWTVTTVLEYPASSAIYESLDFRLGVPASHKARRVEGMKTFVMVLGLLALVTAGPVFSTESAPPPAPAEQSVSSPACSPVVTSSAPDAQNGQNELPSWFTAEPVLWSEELESVLPLAAGCAVYCRECGGCCAIGPSWCACC